MKSWIALGLVAGALVAGQVAAQPLRELTNEEQRLRSDIDGAAAGGRLSPGEAQHGRERLDRIVADDRAMRDANGGRLTPDQVNAIASRLRNLSKELHFEGGGR
jgi:hypothetical protein